MKFFKICFFIILYLLLILLAHPLYLQQSVYEWVYTGEQENKSALIDIYSLDKHEIFVSNDDIKEMTIDYSETSENEGESCARIEFPLSKDWKKYNITFHLKENGKVHIRFRGPAKWSRNHWIPVMADFKDIHINGERLELPQKSLWFENYYDSPVYDVENQQTFTFSVSARRHHLKIRDLKLLVKTYSHWKISSYKSLAVLMTVFFVFLLLIYCKKFKNMFCFLVLSFLIMPLLYFSNEKISERENRGLSKFPLLIADGRINEKFGEEFNAWFSDRFGGRQGFIDIRFSLLYGINGKIANEIAFLADEDWIFPTKGTKIISPSENQELRNQQIADALKKVGEYMKKKDSEIYLVFEPSRSQLYKKYWDKYYPYVPYMEYIKGLREELKDYSNIRFIDLNDVFEKNKDKFQLFEKYDPHMTLSAVNLMLEEMVSALGPDVFEQFQNIITYKERQCTLFSFLTLYDDRLNITSAKNKQRCQEVVIKQPHMKIVEDQIGLREGFVAQPYTNRDLYLLFPCYEEFLFPVLGELFAHTTSVNYNVFEAHDKKKLKKDALARLKEVKSGTVIFIFFSYPTEYDISKSTEYVEDF